jgi:predicted O-linked N-acetylglucosamine transferase (SPINDLY family)
VSPDLRQHSIAYFIEALFTHLDRTQFALWCYHLKPISDAYTLRFQERSEGWRQVHRVSGETLIETVRTDGIDILIDLAGHTDRMIAVFNRRLAPVQVTWLGYPTTSGAAEMDFRISDPEVDPAGRDGLCTEKLMRITPSYYCYSPFETPSPAASTPSMTHGSVTLGSFNNLLKISDFVLSLWGQICRELPEARLVLKHASTRAPETLAALTQRAVGAGIPPERLILADWSPSRQRHLEAYKDVDIALDSAPYNGATTTCESLWMGVPVVTLSGETHAGRMGRSILTAAGLPELVARTPDEYVRRVVALARDVDRLNDYRRELRSRVSASPLMDGKAFVSSLEGALREAWRLWCAGEAPRDIGGPGTSAVFEASGGRST